MKKLILAMLFVFIGSMMAQADDLKVKSGSFKGIQPSGTATVVIDVTKAKYDKKKDLASEYRNLANLMDEITSEFIREFNDEAKKFRIVNTAEADSYKILIQILDVDRHYNPMSWKPGISTKISGNITITDAQGGEVVFVNIDECTNEGIGNEESLEEAFEELAEQLAKRINKGK